ncbi:hypothetical protein [Coralloluteibacterium stylophorae]|uniref:Uncharacterized protein n=1 Tax=Coralloluteibacterium stylophorae TaxID=1776034 RepID=A0A8J8AXW7_9GAMM|nr:hypothetical protein [Coralloluteibacterium stylophorae]MBS7458655.1 hypothetical protein [Coralloluteibacterium stylophorae]
MTRDPRRADAPTPAPPTRARHAARRPLAAAGAVLLALAALNTLYSLAFAPEEGSAAGALLVNAVGAVLGLLLVRGHLGAARAAAWYAAFGIAFAVAAYLVFLPVLKPLAVWMWELRLEFAGTGGALLRGAVNLAALVWVYRCLRGPRVLAARRDAGRGSAPPRSGFVLGAVLVVAIAGFVHHSRSGARHEQAAEVARERFGPDKRYHVRYVTRAHNGNHAIVFVYDDTQARNEQVSW